MSILHGRKPGFCLRPLLARQRRRKASGRACYGCRACGTIHQASAPERPIAKGLATPALLAHVLVSKYCDHLPLYRQSQIFARQGVELDRSTLANWVGGACWWLESLQAKLAEHIFASGKLFADDTPIPVLDPGRGRTKTGRLWVYARDDRPWNGPDPPAALYLYSSDRKAERPASHLTTFSGVVQVDGYPRFDRLREGGRIQLAGCWAHARRKFYEVQQATASPVAAEALRRIAELYAIETSIRGQPAAARQSMRQSASRPLVADLRPGSTSSSLDSRPAAASPMQSAIASLAGMPCADSSTMAVLNSIPIPSNGQSGPLHSEGRITYSPGQMAELIVGRPSARSSQPPSSTMSSPSPISRTSLNACPPDIP